MSGHSSNDSDSVEVVASVQHRRRWSVSEKIRMVEDSERPGMSVSFVARQNRISPSLLFKWRKLVKDGGMSALKADEPVVGNSEVKQLKSRIRERERILGRKTLEGRDPPGGTGGGPRKKRRVRDSRFTRKRFPVKTVCRALKVSRSNVIRRRKNLELKRPGPRPQDDGTVLPRLRDIADRRPTYGYRRIQAVLNRSLKSEGRPPVNHKRIYRILKENNLLLTRSEPHPDRTHDGKVMVLHPNLRWCSDVFEIPCDSGERVRVAFSLDACDREILSYVATTRGIGGEMIRDLMLQSVEARFGSCHVPHPVEWLSDNGSCYTAHNTRRFAEELGFHVCTTPVRSPESNGMAESFVKTFKRDYVSLHACSDALTVMKQLPHWFEDYNEHHPHKGLKMRSPREFRRSYLLQQGCPI